MTYRLPEHKKKWDKQCFVIFRPFSFTDLRKNMLRTPLTLCFTLCLTLVSFFAVNLSTAGDAGPDTMVLKSANGIKPARFPHKRHQESFACKQCHHEKTGEGQQSPYIEGMTVRKCARCHNDNDMSNPKLNSLKLAAHELCKVCHRQYAGSAPTRCSGCHIK